MPKKDKIKDEIKEDWEKEFDEKVEIIHNDLVFGDYSYTKSFIRHLLRQREKANLERIREKMGELKKEQLDKDNPDNYGDVLCDCWF